MDEQDTPVYWDKARKQLYWIEWIETGNNDIPVRHYIGEELSEG